MKPPILLSLAALLGISACHTDDHGRSSAKNEDAVLARSVRMDERTSCVLKADSATWRNLSLTTDQIRWMEDLKLRMRVKDKDTVSHGDTQYVSYTLSDAERRRMAEILTDDQLERWIEMCPSEPVARN